MYEIQKSIDYLNLKGFSNLPQWVAKLDEEVEKKFAQRLSIAIRVWIDVLLDRRKKQEDDDTIIRRRRDNTSDNTSSSNTNNNNNINGSIFSDSFTNLGTSNLDETQSNQINTDNNKDATDIESLFKIGGEPKIKNISLEILF